MLSVLFMTVFSATEPMRFVQQNKATLFVQAGLPNPAVASTKDGEDKTAQSYFDALSEAKGLTNLTDGEKTVGSFTISAFTTKAGNALLKFWQNVTSGTKTVLSCVIDLSSVGKTESDVGTADKIQESWLGYFWRLWSGRSKIFEDAAFTPKTEERVKDFSTKKEGKPDSGYGDFKGLIPRTWKDFDETQKKAAREDEEKRYIPTLLRIQKASFDVADIVKKFDDKFLEVLTSIPEETKKEFNSDLNSIDFNNQTTGYKLNVEFWKIFYEDTLLKIVSDQLSKEEGDKLIKQSLEQVGKLEEQYKTRA